MPAINRILKSHSDVLLLAGVFIITFVIYYPGLNGQFILDDFYNLQNLDLVKNYGYKAYIFSADFAGPSGRPLSLLTFALQYSDWPQNPFAFKFFNLILHLVNGILIFFLSKILSGLIVNNKRSQSAISLLTAGLWLVHPIQISTTLYVVQRMTQASTFFVLLGLIGYLLCRLQLKQIIDVKKIMLLSFIVTSCTLLGILGKENGALLPVFILVIEGTLLSRQPNYPYLKIWKRIFLILPLCLLALYLIINFNDAVQSYHSRNYSMYQKVLTEGRILLEYLKNIIAPNSSSFGLYHDDYLLSKNLLSPVTTLVSAVTVFTLLITGIELKTKQRVISFAIFWFFSGHILESTYLNLEPYFEHRNYLPSFGVFFLLSFTIIKLATFFSRKAFLYAFVGIYIAMIVLITVQEVKIWSSPGLQAVEWSRRHPKSFRALNGLLGFYIVNKDYDNALYTLKKIEDLNPDSIYPDLQHLNIKICRMGQQPDEIGWSDLINHAGTAKFDGLIVVTSIDKLLLDYVKGNCPNLKYGRLAEVIDALRTNPEFRGVAGYLNEFLATLAVQSREYENALQYIRESIRMSSKTSREIYEIQLLKTMGRNKEAELKKTKLLKRLHGNPLSIWAYHDRVETIDLH